MDIGAKIRSARICAGLTQEQAAEALGVSRQTVSNWETEKTYPDILSVVHMSDLYRVSLDHLLRGETQDPTEYLNYLKESTDIVKSNERKSKIILLASYLGIWAFSILCFWLFTPPGSAMVYSLLFLWLVLPVSILFVSFWIGKNGYFGKWKWMLLPAFGLSYLLAEYGTFSMANMISFSKWNSPDFWMFLVGSGLCALGMVLGCAVRTRKQGQEKKKELTKTGCDPQTDPKETEE